MLKDNAHVVKYNKLFIYFVQLLKICFENIEMHITSY